MGSSLKHRMIKCIRMSGHKKRLTLTRVAIVGTGTHLSDFTNATLLNKKISTKCHAQYDL